jgi:hypothetical protein
MLNNSSYNNTMNELDFLLDMPNNFNIDIIPLVNKINNNSITNTSNYTLSLDYSLPLSAIKIKNKTVEKVPGSEIYYKILKEVKGAVRTVEDEKTEKMNKMSSNGNQNVMEKMNFMQGLKNKQEDEDMEPVRNLEDKIAEKNPENRLKRK